MNKTSKIVIAAGLLAGLVLLVAAAPPPDKKAVYGEAKPVGPYSPAIDIGDLVFVAGQIGIDPATGKMVEGGIEAETRQVIRNAEAVLKNAGLGLDDVVKTTVFLKEIGDFQAMNGVYATFFPADGMPPARSTVAVKDLAAGAIVEIDFIAAR